MSVTSKAIDSIRAMIRSGDLAPGERLPPEQELAERLGVSRGSLREAVRALSQINVLDVRRGDGTYVTSLAPERAVVGMVFAVELLQAKDLEEVVEVRQLLLPPAAALAAQRVTDEQLTEMHAVIDQLDRATDPDEIAQLHDRFGSLVYDATGNETLSSILRALQLRGENVRRAWLSADPTRSRHRTGAPADAAGRPRAGRQRHGQVDLRRAGRAPPQMDRTPAHRRGGRPLDDAQTLAPEQV